jgi:hypothetical protein
LNLFRTVLSMNLYPYDLDFEHFMAITGFRR